MLRSRRLLASLTKSPRVLPAWTSLLEATETSPDGSTRTRPLFCPRVPPRWTRSACSLAR
ncbi:hypothetical protein BD777DRAFT_131699 [Yarrowia lipolytica]|nr:hypothetical protein BD777DRAFT_131699 [Yarrowia lipolytica]